MNISKLSGLFRKALNKKALTRYLQDAEHRAILKSILNEPVFIAAMNHLEEESRVSVNAIQVVPAELVARQAAYHRGVGDVYDRLVNLCRVSEPVITPEAWEHISPQPE